VSPPTPVAASWPPSSPAAGPATRPRGRADQRAGAFARIASRLDALLRELGPDEWGAPAIRDLDVQQLVGHLIAVEATFAEAVKGSAEPADADHVDSTQEVAMAQAGRDPALTRSDWAVAVAATKAMVTDGRDLAAPVRMHGVTFVLDAFLVVRAFELWTTTRTSAGPPGDRELTPMRPC